MNFGLPLEDVTQYHLVDVSSDSTAWCFRHNGIIRRIVSPNAPSFALTPTLGYSGQYFDGDIAELLIYTRTLTTAERQSVVQYFNDKYQFLSTPLSPQNVHASAVSANQVSLWWDSVTWPAQLKTRVERKVSGGVFSEVAVVTGASYLDQGLSPSTDYIYRLRASADGVVDSAYSADCPVTTASSGPGIPFGSLRIWLKADTGVVRTGDIPGRVPQWFDQSGNGRHATRALTAYPGPPRVANAMISGESRPVIYFPPYPNGGMFDLPSLENFSQAAEAFIVLRSDVSLGGNGYGIWQMGGGATWYPRSDGAIVDFFGSPGSCPHEFTPALGAILNYHLYSVSCRPVTGGLEWAAWMNGSQVLSEQKPCAVTFPSAPVLGWGNNCFEGDLVEFMLFSRALSEALGNDERQTVREYLRARYDLW
ncbi:MAG: fibronectin type III domain-containing protein [Verrucomicrobia bacterium]|nr:fibronectin type III domain-containing protein [Verrucomicrobiota bacterium]